MERPVVGAVVVTRFPYSDLSSNKVRPALVVAHSDYGDVVLCQITSIMDNEIHSVPITNASFKRGSIPTDSYIRPDKLFTTHQKLILRTKGEISVATLNKVKSHLSDLFGL